MNSSSNLPLFAHGFAACAHRKQRRKYTDAPYVSHCEAVANLVASHLDDQDVICAAMLHDVLEDTDVTEVEMRFVFGDVITDLVLEVTDVSRPDDGNRAERKAKDRAHLANSSANGATIKLADLIDNTSSIVRHDPGFAKIYLREKQLVLPLLRHGNPLLLEMAQKALVAALQSLA